MSFQSSDIMRARTLLALPPLFFAPTAARLGAFAVSVSAFSTAASAASSTSASSSAFSSSSTSFALSPSLSAQHTNAAFQQLQDY
jgi:hypothetical protein